MHDDEEFPPLPFELCTDQKFTIGIPSILFFQGQILPNGDTGSIFWRKHPIFSKRIH
jgi:hypothetical protein